jgi:hypothetical protein
MRAVGITTLRGFYRNILTLICGWTNTCILFSIFFLNFGWNLYNEPSIAIVICGSLIRLSNTANPIKKNNIV